MNYFILSQDRRYTRRLPTIEKFNQLAMRNDFTRENSKKIEDINVVQASSPEPLDYIDLMDHQVFIVSKEVKKIFLMYEPSIYFKMFCMLNNKVNDGQTGEYYAPIFREIDCVSPKSEFNLDKSHIKKLVLFKRKISHFPIFRISKIKKETIIVRLDVAESLLRRKLRGLNFEPVEVQEDEQ